MNKTWLALLAFMFLFSGCTGFSFSGANKTYNDSVNVTSVPGLINYSISATKIDPADQYGLLGPLLLITILSLCILGMSPYPTYMNFAVTAYIGFTSSLMLAALGLIGGNIVMVMMALAVLATFLLRNT